MVIKLSNIAKNYGNLKALSDVSMEVSQGEIFGFLGRKNQLSLALFLQYVCSYSESYVNLSSRI